MGIPADRVDGHKLTGFIKGAGAATAADILVGATAAAFREALAEPDVVKQL